MATFSLCLLPLKSSNLAISSYRIPNPSQIPSKQPTSIMCQINEHPSGESKRVRTLMSTALAGIAALSLSWHPAAMADLNKFEAETRGEFGIGSAAQFGSADLKSKAVHPNENFRRANFTAADMRESNFSGSTFNGAYLEKAVAFKANFTVSDRGEAAVTISYEAQARVHDPIYGCVSHIFALQQQVVNLQTQLATLRQQAAESMVNSSCNTQNPSERFHGNHIVESSIVYGDQDQTQFLNQNQHSSMIQNEQDVCFPSNFDWGCREADDLCSLAFGYPQHS